MAAPTLGPGDFTDLSLAASPSAPSTTTPLRATSITPADTTTTPRATTTTPRATTTTPADTTTTPRATTTPAGVTTPKSILKRSLEEFDLDLEEFDQAALGRSSHSVLMARARLDNPENIASPSSAPLGQSSDSVIVARQRLLSPEVRKETDEVVLSSDALQGARASSKSLVPGHKVRAPCLSDVGEESGELGGSRPVSLGSRPASTKLSVLEKEELSTARSRRSVYQPDSLISASKSLGESKLEGLVGVEEAQEEDKEQVTTSFHSARPLGQAKSWY